MHLISPTEVELGLRRFERRIVKTFAQRSNLVGIILASAALSLYIYAINGQLFALNHYATQGGFLVIRLIRKSIYFSVLMSPLLLVVRDRIRVTLLFATFLTIWTVSSNDLLHFDLPSIAIYLSVPLFSLLGWCYLRWFNKYRWPGAFAYITICLLIFGGVTAHLYYSQQHENLIRYWRLKTHFIWMSVLAIGLTQRSSPNEAIIALCPTNAMRGILWPLGSHISDDNQLRRRELWWLGFSNVFVGYSAIALRMGLQAYPFYRLKETYLRSPSRYILAILGIIGFLNILAGVIRMFGYRIPDATNFVWLSRTPAEFWRRGSVYQYTFVLRFVYLPLTRFFKKSWPALPIAFFIFLLIKTGPLDILSLALDITGSSWNSPFFSRREYSRFIYWALWFLILAGTRRYWPFPWRSRELALLSWVSILCSHLVICGIFYWTRILWYIVRDKHIVW
jgi:hypothetical protein